MREWLIRKLGGIPRPKLGHTIIASNIFIDGIEIRDISGKLVDVIHALGGVPLPKAGEGQYLRSPAVCRNPVRKTKVAVENVTLPPATQALVDAIEAGGGEVHVVEMKMTMINLCDDCKALVGNCHTATKETDSQNNTTKCDQYVRPL